MSNYIGVFVLILILTYVNSQNATQEYTIHRDFFNGFKAAEFSVFDTSEKNIHYRLESNYGVTQNVKVIAYPSKQEVGRLQAKITVVLYNGDISILNPRTNQWNNGLIEQNFKLLASSFNVNWNGHRITLETEAFELTSKFYDEDRQLLAQFRMRPFVLFKVKYYMKVFSNKYPEQLYLLALAAHDRVRVSRGKG
jgi:hypothetical protein